MSDIAYQYEQIIHHLREAADENPGDAVVARFRVVGGRQEGHAIFGLHRSHEGEYTFALNGRGVDHISTKGPQEFNGGRAVLADFHIFDIENLSRGGIEMVPQRGLQESETRIMGVSTHSRAISGVGITQVLVGPETLLDGMALHAQVRDAPRNRPQPRG